MHSNNGNRSRTASTRGFMALFAIMLTMGLGALASPAEAAPFAYVVNNGDNTVSVIDTATNTVVVTVTVGSLPNGVAITPDRTHAYVANAGGNMTPPPGAWPSLRNALSLKSIASDRLKIGCPDCWV